MIKRISIRSWGSKQFSIAAVVEGGLAIHPALWLSDDGRVRITRYGMYSITHLESGCTIGGALPRGAAVEHLQSLLEYRFQGLAIGQISGCEMQALGAIVAPAIGLKFNPAHAAVVAEVLACQRGSESI